VGFRLSFIVNFLLISFNDPWIGSLASGLRHYWLEITKASTDFLGSQERTVDIGDLSIRGSPVHNVEVDNGYTFVTASRWKQIFESLLTYLSQ
jgi:hypothetical protein